MYSHGDIIALEHQASGTMTCYLTQSHYPDTEPTIPCPILIILSIRLGSDKYTFLSYWFDSTRARKLQGPDSNPRPSDFPIFQNGRRTLYSFGHHDWLVPLLMGEQVIYWIQLMRSHVSLLIWSIIYIYIYMYSSL